MATTISENPRNTDDSAKTSMDYKMYHRCDVAHTYQLQLHTTLNNVSPPEQTMIIDHLHGSTSQKDKIQEP
jgi:hypothetical protein